MKKTFVVILTLSVSVNIAIICGFVYLKYYKYPAYYRDTVKLVSGNKPEARQTVFLGDSFVSRHHWHRLDSVISVSVYGLGGSTVKDWKTALSEIQEQQPIGLIVWLGINNLLRGDQPDSLAFELIQFAEYIRNNITSELTILSVFPVAENYPGSSGINNDILHLNNLLLKSADRRYRFIDISEAFVDSTGNLNRLLSNDGLHLNRWGYDLAELLLLREL